MLQDKDLAVVLQWGPVLLARNFCEFWPNPPSPETHLTILRQSFAAVVARDDWTSNVVGFVTAISDGILAAYIPLLEVLPAYRGRGIGTELMRRVLVQFGTF